jgi:hypothetical protein
MALRQRLHLSPKIRRELEKQTKTTLLDHLRRNRKNPVYLSGMCGLGEQVFSESEQNAKAAEIMRKAPATELYDKQSMGPGWPDTADAIPKVIQFCSRAGNKLVDIPLDLAEGVRREVIENYGVAPEDADKIASQAVDRWIEIEPPPPPMSAAQAQNIQRVYAPAFSVESLPGNLGELPAATAAITQKYSGLGWKEIIPIALGVGLVVLLLKKR